MNKTPLFLRFDPDDILPMESAAELMGVEPDSLYRRVKRLEPDALVYGTKSVRVIKGIRKSFIDRLRAKDGIENVHVTDT